MIPFQSVQLVKVIPDAKNKLMRTLTDQTMNADEHGGSPAAYVKKCLHFVTGSASIITTFSRMIVFHFGDRHTESTLQPISCEQVMEE